MARCPRWTNSDLRGREERKTTGMELGTGWLRGLVQEGKNADMGWGHVGFKLLVGHPRGDPGVPTFPSSSDSPFFHQFHPFALSFLTDLFVNTSLPSSF